ncbi:hypothetical protein Tco_0394506 [Tanacetum coccineum]
MYSDSDMSSLAKNRAQHDPKKLQATAAASPCSAGAKAKAQSPGAFSRSLCKLTASEPVATVTNTEHTELNSTSFQESVRQTTRAMVVVTNGFCISSMTSCGGVPTIDTHAMLSTVIDTLVKES